MNREQEILHGGQAIERLGDMLEEKGVNRIIVFHGTESWKNPIFQRLESVLRPHSAVWREFSDIPRNFEFNSIEKVRNLYIELNPTLVIACGGGSVIDFAKGVLAAGSLGSMDQFLERNLEIIARPLFVAIPTTAGSGSEATRFAVIYKNRRKHSIEDIALKPDIVVHYPLLPASCPLSVTLASGADAICQALESLWARTSTIQSRTLAKQALDLLYPNLLKIADNPYDMERWAHMQRGAWLAGSAIDISKTTAGHAMSYGLTIELGIPHGFAVLAIMQHLAPYMEKRFSFFSSADSELGDIKIHGSYGESLSFQDFIQEMASEIWARQKNSTAMKSILQGASAFLSDTARESRIELLLDSVNAQRLGNHPVALGRNDLEAVFRQVLDHLNEIYHEIKLI